MTRPLDTRDALDMLQEAADRFHHTLGAHVVRWTEPGHSDEWSPAHVCEHVTLTNELIRSVLDHLVPLDGRPPALVDDELPHVFSRGEEPPGVAEPTGTWTDADAALARFAESAEAFGAMAAEPPLDLRGVGAPHPVFGLLDGVQWLLFVAAHVEDHRARALGSFGR